MSGHSRIETQRLILRTPEPADAEAIFGRYGGDTEVTHYLGWPRHRSVEDTKLFLQFSAACWQRGPVGPYLIESREDGRLLGSTGLDFESPTVASTGYVLARDAWGRGYATEALQAMVALARELGVQEMFALCHPEHSASAHVLEKCGFTRAAERPPLRFPNLGGEPQESLRYTRRP